MLLALGPSNEMIIYNAWLGCSSCEAWIDRGCESTEDERTTEAQIWKLNFVCFSM